jgi:hypothetical protein
MSDLLPRLRALSLGQTPNAALFDALRELNQRNEELVAAMVAGLDEQDELVGHYVALNTELLRRQGQSLAVTDQNAEPPVHETLLGNGWY